jgi:hypothetical protein
MSKKKNVGLVAAAAALAGVLVLPSSAEAGRIKGRAGNQQDRIAQGVGSGSLTARESARLERREAHLNREVHRMRQDGSLGPRERARVERQQDRISRGIYRQKHDGQSQ